MKEAAVVLDLTGKAIHWHLPADRTGGSLPDSRDLWDVIWENRATIEGIAHSHPGSGVPGPSWEDVTTFSAIELAIGRQLKWWITSSDHVIVAQFAGPNKYSYRTEIVPEPDWAPMLRAVSVSPAHAGEAVLLDAIFGGATKSDEKEGVT